MKHKVCLITGATSGIGKATALALAKMGSTIIVNGKDEKRGEETIAEIKRISGNENVELMIANLSSLNEVRKLADRLKGKYDKLDILINNAAVFYTSGNLSIDGIEMQFAVNHLSHFLLTNLLLETLKESNSARVINVSSNAHYQGRINFDDINFEKRYFGWTVYCQSKLANVLFTYELADRLDPKQITVNALHPGTVRTNIVGKYASFIYRLGWNLQKPLMLPVEEGAKTSIYLASSEEVKGITGLYFVKCKSQKSSEMSYDKMLARKLWDLSEKLTGFKFSENQ
jgi:NAD(P)-dependent dehydrogenase (short-subunit alcohol dehydrogenase family)